MARIPGSVPLTGFIAPNDELDTYHVTDEFYNKGGYRTVNTLAERDAITTDRQKGGMLVFVWEDNTRYRLLEDLSGWEIDNSGSAGIPEAPLGGVIYGRQDAAWVDLAATFFTETEHIIVSAGAGDSGKPIVLNAEGQIDASMIDASTFYYVAPFTPAAGAEYPDTTGETHGAFWVVQDLTADYTFVDPGELLGLVVRNGDFMVWGSAGWSIMRGEMNPTLYYKLDGTLAITADFNGGGLRLQE